MNDSLGSGKVVTTVSQTCNTIPHSCKIKINEAYIALLAVFVPTVCQIFITKAREEGVFEKKKT